MMKKLRLAKIGTNYSKETFEVIHDAKMVSEYEINKVNAITDQTGIIYVPIEEKKKAGRPKKTRRRKLKL